MARTKRQARPRTYRVTFWRNDGRWNDCSYNYRPTVIFQARIDKKVIEAALAYIAKNRRGNEDLWIDKIVEIVQPEVTRIVTLFDAPKRKRG